MSSFESLAPTRSGKSAVEWVAGSLITAYTTMKYREPLSPELKKAVEGVQVNGLLDDKQRNIHDGVEFLQFLGTHGQQAIAGIKLFFEAVLQSAMEGFFSDPIYGGNRDMAGWKMVGYPGLPATYRDDIKTYFGKKYDKPPRSIADFS